MPFDLPGSRSSLPDRPGSAIALPGLATSELDHLIDQHSHPSAVRALLPSILDGSLFVEQVPEAFRARVRTRTVYAPIPHYTAVYLALLAPYLWRPGQDIVDVCCNEPGRLIMEMADGSWIEDDAPWLTLDHAWAMLYCFAAWQGTTLSPRMPLLSLVLPGRHRLMAMMGPNIETGLAFSIRVNRNIERDLTDYAMPDATALAASARSSSAAGRERTEDIAGLQAAIACGDGDRIQELVLRRVERRDNIYLVGGTGVGKTEAIRTICALLPSELANRTAKVQDVQELDLWQVQNQVGFVVRRGDQATDIRMPQIIDAVNRMNFRRVLVGEVSTENAPALVRLLNSGTTGIMVTGHGDDELGGCRAIQQNVALSAVDQRMDPASALQQFVRSMHLILMLDRLPNGRRAITSATDPTTLLPLL
jgi:type IV secretory pathway ATPase VirB11/archaellum biosynthesis ATPase